MAETASLIGRSRFALRVRAQTWLSQEKWLRRFEAAKRPNSHEASKYTAEEDAELTRMRNEGMIFRKIGTVLKRSVSSVAQRWYHLSRGSSARVWKAQGHQASPNLRADEQIELLLNMKLAGASHKKMAMELGIGRELVRTLLRQHCGVPQPTQQPWTESELEILLSQPDGARYITKLATMLPGRSRDDIKEELWRQGFVFPKKWTAAEDEELLRLGCQWYEAQGHVSNVRQTNQRRL